MNLGFLTTPIETMAAFVVVLGVLVLVHEFGHFWVAKRAGVRVLKFSIGMGPKIVGVTRGDTEYLLSWVPFGGYVKMAGEDPEEEKSGAPDEFSSKPTHVRAAIIIAGPLMNYLLALAIYIAIAALQGQDTIKSLVIGRVEPESFAAEAGLTAGDRVVAVDGVAVTHWYDFLERLVARTDRPHAVRVARGGSELDLNIDLAGFEAGGKRLGLISSATTEIGSLQKDGPAWKAGLRRGDRIVSIAGEPVALWEDVAEQVADRPGVPLEIAWDRGGERMNATITPVPEEAQGPDGKTITVGRVRIGQVVDHVSLSPWAAVRAGTERTLFVTQQMLGFFGDLVRMRVSFDMVGGPIRIGQIAGESWRWGAPAIINLIALLSVNLAILNLLPIPVLDGGHLFLMAIETVRRKPLSLKQRIVLQQIGLVVIILLMVSVTTGDIRRLFQR
jgi:regulator of sigma E protease